MRVFKSGRSDSTTMLVKAASTDEHLAFIDETSVSTKMTRL
jgi:hypothetical protein